MVDTKLSSAEKEKNIEKKEREDHSEALEKVDSSSDIADLMEGVDDNVSEKVSESKDGKGDDKKSKSKATNDDKKRIFPYRPLPSPNVMRRKTLQKMQSEEKNLISNLQKFEKNPREYSEKVKEIRSLRQKITDFLHATLDVIKETYLKFFGERHGVETKEEEK